MFPTVPSYNLDKLHHHIKDQLPRTNDGLIEAYKEIFSTKNLTDNLSKLNGEFNLFTLSRTNSDINCDLSVFQPILPEVDIVIHSAGLAHILTQSKRKENNFFRSI
mgnify:CR=1 FL=1